jgi:hypothetical protein
LNHLTVPIVRSDILFASLWQKRKLGVSHSACSIGAVKTKRPAESSVSRRFTSNVNLL